MYINTLKVQKFSYICKKNNVMAKAKELEVVKLNSIYQECLIWDSLLNVTAWSNGEGFDLTITSKHGGLQHISITYCEFDVLKKCVSKLEKL